MIAHYFSCRSTLSLFVLVQDSALFPPDALAIRWVGSGLRVGSGVRVMKGVGSHPFACLTTHNCFTSNNGSPPKYIRRKSTTSTPDHPLPSSPTLPHSPKPVSQVTAGPAAQQLPIAQLPQPQLPTNRPLLSTTDATTTGASSAAPAATPLDPAAVAIEASAGDAASAAAAGAALAAPLKPLDAAPASDPALMQACRAYAAAVEEAAGKLHGLAAAGLEATGAAGACAGAKLSAAGERGVGCSPGGGLRVLGG